MTFEQCFNCGKPILMEGALGERLKRDYKLTFDKNVALAGLVYDEEGRQALKKLWTEYIDIAIRYKMPFIATTPTRRANEERVNKSEYNENIIRDNVDFLKSIRNCYSKEAIYLGGLMGCKGDAYKANEVLSRSQAADFHSWQAALFQNAKVDFLYAGIMPALEETLGMSEAMAKTDLPYIISFMIRKDGCLIDGTNLSDAIQIIDKNVERKPLCYMSNCTHPKVVMKTLSYDFNRNESVWKRFRGIQPNTSDLSPENLDNSAVLFESNPKEFAKEIVSLQNLMDITICGGCCGTDLRHIEEIAKELSD
ncbi:homocysteine S-methyltransferase [Clostridia bacterium]|nr:homocysteine S-methyltransferase [Clostridia bacterium]